MSRTEKSSSFSQILKSPLRMDDQEWAFSVSGLPRPGDLNQRRLVKKIVLRSDMKALRHTMVLKIEPIEENRAIKGDSLDRYILLSLEDFRPLRFVRGGTAEHETVGLQPATWKDCTDYAIRLLRAGISMQGVLYHFYGHSNSQLKSRTCFLYAASKEEISKKVEALGDFRKMKTVAKKAKRIGLLFSVARVAMIVPPDRCQDIPDIETPDYIFTDGCGLIAPSLASELARRVRIVFRDKRYTPSVFQIRYRGYKGVVTVDPRMRKEKPLLKLRKSMNKFSGAGDNSFAVVEYSKPYTYGFLNDESIILLDALGIPRSVLVKKQDDHFKLLSEARTDFRAAFCFLSYVGKPELAEKLLMEGIESMRPQINRLVNAEYGKMLNKRDEQRCRILVRKSRLLFGVCDAWDVLKEGECAVKVTLEGDGQPYALKGTEVAVIRNPCLHPGDWQKLKVVEKPELAHLVDCIVFSTRGKRPAADMMSGGDLDGDQFFVCWDQELTPSILSQPASYPGGREPLRFNPITDDDRLVYFAKYTNASLGQVKHLYMDWARARGAMSPECQELNRLFSQCVDGNRIRIPEKHKSAPAPPPDAPTFVLDELHARAKQSIQQSSLIRTDLDGYPLDALDILLARDDVAMSEFDFIQLSFRWCRQNGVCLEYLLNMFDFNVLTDEEKAWVLAQLPVSVETPSTVLNALCSSGLLDPSELSHFQLNHAGIRWKCVYDSSRDRLATFLDVAARTMEVFHRKLIVFRPDERLTLAIYVPRIIERSSDVVVDNSVRLFAFPHSQGHEKQSRLSLPTKMTYRLYCDGNIFQLFQNNRSNSWIWITRPGSDDSEYRDLADGGDRRRQRQSTVDRGVNSDVCASIALDKFSKGLQKHIGRVNRAKVCAAEIYVISNRDVKSMQSLDLWLEYVETGERLPLFKQEPKEYALPQLHDILPTLQSDGLADLIKSQQVSGLERLSSVEEYVSLFDALISVDDRSLLLKSFDWLLNNILKVQVQPDCLLRAMVAFLAKAPFLAISFGKLRQDEILQGHEELATLLDVYALPILRSFIISAEQADELILEPLKLMLSKIPNGALSLREFANLVEVVSLTVRSQELSLDILLACFGEQCERLLSGQPEVIRRTVKNLTGIAVDHIGEASEQGKNRDELFELKHFSTDEDGYAIVEIPFRLDAPGGTPEIGTHIRLTAATLPTNVIVGKRRSIDGLVTHSEQGVAKVRCLHPLPSFYQDCSWKLQHCGSFVTTKTTFDAVRTLAAELGRCCQVAEQILGLPWANPLADVRGLAAWKPVEKLNASQNAAVEAALTNPLVCLWGPPGTGKTETIVEMICALQEEFKDARILVTAPTHNAVDNVMRRYTQRIRVQPIGVVPQPSPVRVSTDVRKVADDLRSYTCDAMAGQELYSNYKALNQAKKKIKACRIVFTTCIGSGLGLLRSEDFEIVIVDEASQQTEPASLVPLVKGCTKAILVGDHVQLRPTVQQHSLLVDFDVSLFERLYTTVDPVAEGGMRKLMLDTQYRMHPAVSAFSSREFYNGNLKTGIMPDSRPLPASCFPWPPAMHSGSPTSRASDRGRLVFIQCSAKEAPGQKSKENEVQAKLCAHVCKLLTSPTEAHSTEERQEGLPIAAQTIAVLTPYTRQAELLKRILSGQATAVEVSSIDGFQGREADVIVFVTVRCNEHREIGFLKDLRRMNVALTRAKAGLIVIGDRATLTEGTAEPESTAMWRRLLDSMAPVKIEAPSQ